VDELVDDVVLAVPPSAAEALAPPEAIELEPGWAAELASTPIINLHVVYDRVVLDEPFVAAIDSPLQWVFDRTRQAGLTQGQYLGASLSAADDIVDAPTSVLRDRFLPHLERLLRITSKTRVLEFFVTRERQATFRQRPGTVGLRASARTALPGLYLAGAWTDTGWPATMEGAVRSGEAAVAAMAAVPSPRTPWTAIAGLSYRRCAKPSSGSIRPPDWWSPTTSAGPTNTEHRPNPTLGRRSALRLPCSRPKPSPEGPSQDCRARWPSSSSTTSRCSTTT
jgi:hypothetical protein